MDDEIATRPLTVTCRTADCGNNGIEIVVTVPDLPDAYVACGVCGARITELREAGE
jgi:ribosomal protein S27E